ncbi:MAG TPA: SCP2 sterol-binding domain-containing protein [Gammaproteobacteria bacterium]|nr:SCP2 sterol-binding domain-containing protein [Gammaproteobacteria bacterium]
MDSLRNSLLAAAEIGGNRLLAYDEAALAGCRELQGHCIAIEITDLDFTLYCHPGNWGIRLSQTPPPRDAEATISGRLMALVNLASEDDKLATSMQERVGFRGDVKLAQKLQSILGGLDIDWEEALAKITGDVVAFQVHQRARRLGEWLKQSADSLLQTTSDYLREEARASPTMVEFEQFQSRVTALKNDVSRAEARLARLLERARSQ